MKFKNWSSLILLAIILVGSIITPNVNMNNSIKSFINEDADFFKYTEEMRDTFLDDNVFILIFHSDENVDSKLLEKIGVFHKKIERSNNVKEVNSVFSIDHITGTEDGYSVEPLMSDTNLTMERLKDNKVAQKMLYSIDGKNFAVIVELELDDSSLRTLATSDLMYELIDELKLKDNLVAFAGPLGVDVIQFKTMENELLIKGSISFLVALLIVGLIFKSLQALFITLFSVLAVSNLVYILYYLTGAPFNTISSMTPSIVTALTVAALVHLFHSLNSTRSVEKAVRKIKAPTFYACLTTAIGLFSLMASDVPPVKTFGLIGGITILFIFVVTIYLAPNLIKLPLSKKSEGTFLSLISYKIMKFTLKRPVGTIIVSCALAMFAIIAITYLESESNMIKFFRSDHEIAKSVDYIDRELSGTNSVMATVTDADIDHLISFEKLNKVWEIQKYAETLSTVDKTVSVVDFVRTINWANFEANEKNRILPKNDDLIYQYIASYSGQDIFNYITKEYDLLSITFSINTHNAKETGRIIDNITAFAKTKGIDLKFAGDGLLFAEQEKLLVWGQIQSLMYSLVLIFFVLIVLWRSLKYASITIIPNIAPIFTIFATMSVCGIYLDVGTAMISSVAVGIAIDDTIHMFNSFRKHFKDGDSPLWSIARSYKETGGAMIATSVILSVQFMILSVSEFVPTSNFGLMTTIGLMTALIADLTLLPAILAVIYIKRK